MNPEQSNILLKGDINLVIKEINEISKDQVDENLVQILSKVLDKFSKSCFIPIEYAEELLSALSKFTERLEENIKLLSGNKQFISSVVGLLKEYHTCFTDPSYSCSFSSHHCYEQILFILLGCIEKSFLLTEFLSVIDDKNLTILFENLSSIILKDILYLTQEMALEVLLREGHFLVNRNATRLQDICKNLPVVIKTKLLASKEEILTYLREMRPIINGINESNPNIESVKLNNLILSFPNDSKRFIIESTIWLDCCVNFICFQIPYNDGFIRIPKKNLIKLNIDRENSIFKLIISNLDERSFQAFQTLSGLDEELTNPLKINQLQFKIHDSEILNKIESNLQSKIVSIKEDDVFSKKIKYSEVSSRDLQKSKNEFLLPEENELAATTEPGDTVSSISSPDLGPEDPEATRLSNLRSSKRLRQNEKDSLFLIGKEINLNKKRKESQEITKTPAKSRPTLSTPRKKQSPRKRKSILLPKRNPVKKGAKMRSPYDNKTKEQQPKESEDIESHPTIANPTKDIEDTKKYEIVDQVPEYDLEISPLKPDSYLQGNNFQEEKEISNNIENINLGQEKENLNKENNLASSTRSKRKFSNNSEMTEGSSVISKRTFGTNITNLERKKEPNLKNIASTTVNKEEVKALNQPKILQKIEVDTLKQIKENAFKPPKPIKSNKLKPIEEESVIEVNQVNYSKNAPKSIENYNTFEKELKQKQITRDKEIQELNQVNEEIKLEEDNYSKLQEKENILNVTYLTKKLYANTLYPQNPESDHDLGPNSQLDYQNTNFSKFNYQNFDSIPFQNENNDSAKGSSPKPVEYFEDDEEENALSILMNEIIAIQKERKIRRAQKAFKSILESAEVQLFGFIQQWSRVIEYYDQDSEQLVKFKTESLLASATGLLDHIDQRLQAQIGLLHKSKENIKSFSTTFNNFQKEAKQFQEMLEIERRNVIKDIEKLANCIEIEAKSTFKDEIGKIGNKGAANKSNQREEWLKMLETDF